MKFNNENAKEQIAYVAPKSRLIHVKIEGVICTSGDYNEQGLQNIYGDHVNDESDSWGVN